MSRQDASHGLKFQARTIAPQAAENSKSRWLAGTNALREENEVQLLELDGDRNVLKVTGAYAHAPEIWCIAPSPSNPDHFATVFNKGGTYGVAIWSIPAEGRDLRELGQLSGHKGTIRTVRWHPKQAQSLATVEEGFLRTWTVDGGAVQEAGKAEVGTAYSFWTGAWDGKDAARFCTAGGSSIQLWDLRSLKQTTEIEGAHSAPIRDLDFAHQAEHLLASAGDDCRAKVWDTRSLSKPVVQVSSHAHWIWQAQFNPFHDQLLLSSSSDAVINLLHLPGLTRQAGGQRGSAAKDSCAASYDSHEDSVYGVAWSAVDPWTFAAVSYDGRVTVNQVPSGVKYKILI